MAHRSVLPLQAPIKPASITTMCNTITGNYKPVGILTAEQVRFPEFDANVSVNSHDFLIFDPKCSFDLILGNDFLHKIGLKIHLDTLQLEWLGKKVPTNSRFMNDRLTAAVNSCLIEERRATSIIISIEMNVDQAI